MYLLIEFTETKELAIIPDNWIDSQGRMCGLWPPFKNTSRLSRAVLLKEPPLDSWKSYPIREMYRNESYEKVRSKLKKAEVDSDLQTDQELNEGRPVRKRRSPNRYTSESDSDGPQQPPKKSSKDQLPKPPSSIPTPSISATPSRINQQLETISKDLLPRPTPSATPTSNRQIETSIARDMRIFLILEQIKAEQQNHTTLLTTILARLGQGEVDPLPEDMEFPISSNLEIDGFEEKLKDKNVQKAVISHLASIGGTCVENMASRILKYVLSNTQSMKYNWTGANNKMAFRSLTIPFLLKRAIKTTFRQVTSADVEKSVKSFLKSAKDRDGGRSKRMKAVRRVSKSPTPPVDSSDSNTDDYQ